MKKFNYLLLAAMVILGSAACSKNKGNEGPPGEIKGQPTSVQLRFKEYVPNGTRTASAHEEATEKEAKLHLGAMKVFVFDAKTTVLEQIETVAFEADETTLNPVIYRAKTNIIIMSGDKIFAIYSDPKGLIEPHWFTPGNSTVQSLQDRLLAVQSGSFPANAFPDEIADNSGEGKFLIGTLWVNSQLVKSGGTPEAPEPVSLNIGRIASKARLLEVTNTVFPAGTPLENGTIINPLYRVVSIPNRIKLLGDFAGSTPPDVNQLGYIRSAAHTKQGYDPITKDQDPFFDMYPWDGQYGAVTPGTELYIVENSRSTIVELVYGNTSYLQMKFKFQPQTTWIMDPTDGTMGASLDANGDFWVAEYENNKTIFKSNPKLTGSEEVKAKLGDKLWYYAGGEMCYDVPIKYTKNNITNFVEHCDPNHQIIRNHYYELRVLAINDFGKEDSSPIQPDIPIPTITEVALDVTVLPWAKVTQDIIW